MPSLGKTEEKNMKQYIGTKLIEAEPAYRCMDERGNVAIALSRREALRCYPTVEEGYRVRYQDGYESWSPRGVFEEAYRPTDHLSFGLAIEAAKKGKRISRAGWNGKGQHVELASNIAYINPAGVRRNADHAAIGNKALAFVGTSGVQIGWLASQADMLADDWMIVEGDEYGQNKN